ncbi:3527_t:CDS:2 [Scutellospora calospora]|uniref:3527_t:CDS:1 n=1 Tax=Scutellospora calospora TaxID=85575 RepID=A0ACA9K1B6_9GLOM|nr:3527_t:CDS:2 [Scutellospora calospora]
MPNMNGYELLDAIRSNVKTQLIPVILLSAKAGEDSKIRGLDKGADDYLTKPFSSRELITRIRNNIELSITRRKILFQQYEQEKTNQLLLSISNKIISKLDLNETLQNIIKEIHHILPCERIFIISNEPSESNDKNNKIFATFEDSESITPMINPFKEISVNNNNKSQTFTMLQENSNKNLGIDISLDVYCDDIRKNASVLAVEIRLDDLCGWIKAYRSPNSIWLDSEIELLQQISNQISLAISYTNLLEKNSEYEIQIKAVEIANFAKSQILANTSHELRTPLGVIVGFLSCFEDTTLTSDQKDMINIMAHSSDVVLSIVNDLLDAAKLEAQKVTLMNRTFDLSELLESTIEKFEKKAGEKNLELIVNCDVDMLPRYIKSDPKRVNFTNKGIIVLTISMQSQDVMDKNEMNSTYGQMFKKENLLIELYDTGIGFSQGDMSITREHTGTGLGLSICKNLVEINGGEIKVESQLGKGSKFWFIWNIESLSITRSLLETQFDDQISYNIRQKRILIIHPIKEVRNAMLKYLKRIEKVDAFDTFDKGINAIKIYKPLNNRFVYDIVFIRLYENNEALNAALELKRLNNNIVIIFIVFPNNEENELAKKLIEKVGGTTLILYTPITLKKLELQWMEKNAFEWYLKSAKESNNMKYMV